MTLTWPVGDWAQGPPSANPALQAAQAPSSPADRTFAAFVDRYFDGFFRFYPDKATSAGLHPYDAELPAYSRKEIEAEIARSKRALQELAKIPREGLSHDNQFDARLLESSIRGNLLDLKQIRMWEKDPTFYDTQIGSALFVLIQRDFAPLDERLKSLISREQRVPEILQSARQNLLNPPAVYTKVAILQVSSEIGFLKDDLPKAIESAQNPELKEEFKNVNQRAIQEYEKFLHYLKTELTPRSQGSFALGAENYRKKLLYDEMVDIPLDRLLKIGEQELRKTQADFKSTAALIDPAKSPAEVLKDLSRDHPDSTHLLASSEAALEGIRTFVVSHQIATILSPENPRVIDTPAFMRVLAFAAMDSPGPFEETSSEAFYYVTLPDRDWSHAKREEFLRAFNRYSLQTTAIHEVFPGHHTQGLWLKRNPSKVRKIVGASSNDEGWAHYCEQMMLEQGYGAGDPKLLLFQLQDALLRICRYLVGIRMHTRGMTLEEAIAFFEKEGHQEHANAELEAERGTSDPTYLVYTLGKLQILKLREDYKEKMGDRFSLKEFHDRFLSLGYPPIKMIREEMLGNNSPSL